MIPSLNKFGKTTIFVKVIDSSDEIATTSFELTVKSVDDKPVINSISGSSFTRPELAYLKESLILVDKCLTIAQVPEKMINEQDVRDFMQCSGKAIRLLKSVGKRTGIPFNYSFLNDLQVQIAEDIKPIKTFTQFSGEMYGI